MSEDMNENRSTLVSRNITVLGKRTSVRLEPEMWKELKGIAKREQCTIHDLCTLISLRKNAKTSLTAAIRVFLMLYFRAASTEDGHARAGHGNFSMMKRRAGVDQDWSALKLKREIEQNNDEPHADESAIEAQEESAKSRHDSDMGKRLPHPMRENQNALRG